jgi:hypothetical protein
MPSVRITLATSLALTAAAVGAVLSHAPLTVAGSDSATGPTAYTVSRGGISLCERYGTVPGGTSAIRVSLGANVGPRVAVRVTSGSRVVAHGARSAGWGADATVTVPVTRVPHTITNAVICTTLGPAAEPVELEGTPVKASVAGGGFQGLKLHMEYLRPGRGSWWPLASSIATRMGYGRAPSGAWVALLALAIMLAVVALACWTVLGAAMIDGNAPARTLARARSALHLPAVLRRIPRAAWTCALIAFLNAACWSFITPPFQVPDEPSHFAYTQQLAEARRMPTSHSALFSPEERVVLRDLHQSAVREHPGTIPISSPAEQRQLQEGLAMHLPRYGIGAAGVATSEPPLYYLLETIPYELGSGGTLLDQLQLMRLLSALMGALTAFFVFLFVREALPAVPWAWTAGGMCVALAPLLAFMSGADNPDAMLFAVSAALFYCLARAFRRGLTRRLAVAIGSLAAVGFLTKINFVGLAPGVALGLAALAVRAKGHRRAAFASAALALALAASPVYLYLLANLLSRHAGLGVASHAFASASAQSAFIPNEASYIWQFYLPRLPGMTDRFPGLSTTRLWFDRSVGLYGWLDTSFPVWVENIALLPAGLTALLCARALVLGRASLRERLAELGTYAVMAMGLMALIAAISYINMNTSGVGYTQPRYLLPLVPLVAAAVALAVRGSGRRWGPAAGALVVMLVLAHDIFSQLLVVARFYA